MASSKLTPSTSLGLFIIHTDPSKQEKEMDDSGHLLWTVSPVVSGSLAGTWEATLLLHSHLTYHWLTYKWVPGCVKPSLIALNAARKSCRLTQVCPSLTWAQVLPDWPFVSLHTFNNCTQKELVPPTHLGGCSAFPALHGRAMQRDLARMTGPLIHKLSLCLKTHSAESKRLSGTSEVFSLDTKCPR